MVNKFSTILTAVLAVLKLTLGLSGLSWWLVFSPILAVIAVQMSSMLILGAIVSILILICPKDKKEEARDFILSLSEKD